MTRCNKCAHFFYIVKCFNNRLGHKPQLSELHTGHSERGRQYIFMTLGLRVTKEMNYFAPG